MNLSTWRWTHGRHTSQGKRQTEQGSENNFATFGLTLEQSLKSKTQVCSDSSLENLAHLYSFCQFTRSFHFFVKLLWMTPTVWKKIHYSDSEANDFLVLYVLHWNIIVFVYVTLNLSNNHKSLSFNICLWPVSSCFQLYLVFFNPTCYTFLSATGLPHDC